MATVSSVSGEEGLVALLGRETYDDYFGDTATEGGDSNVGGTSSEDTCVWSRS